MDRALLGIDLGTTGCKAMLFDTDGAILGSRYIEYGLIFTPEGVEQDSEDWWTNVCLCVRGALKEADIEPSSVAALSISSQGISGVPVDAEGRALYNSLNWLDNRSVEEQAEMQEALGLERIRTVTGKNKTDYSLPELCWLLRRRREELAGIRRYLMPLDYLTLRMTGRALTDYSMACGTLAFNIRRHEWESDFFRALDIPENLFADALPMGTPVGRLTPKAAEELGLSTDTLVVLGAQDQRCASLGAGMEKGIVTVSLGTAAALCSLVDEPVTDPLSRVTCCTMDGQRGALESTMGAAGAGLKWLRNTCFKGTPYPELDELALAAGPGSHGLIFLPRISSEEGMFFGLSLDTAPGDMARAVLEGVAFELRRQVGDHERLLGEPIRELRIFGGGSSKVWLQIIADITGKTVVRPRTAETACLGAALLAAKGLGLAEDIYQAQDLIGAPSARFTPHSENEALYAKAYEKYLSLSAFIDSM